MTYKQRFTFLCQSLLSSLWYFDDCRIVHYLVVAVHNRFTDAVIHLIDAMPGLHVQRDQALRYLQVCVDAPQQITPR
jgi:hypothetical protein